MIASTRSFIASTRPAPFSPIASRVGASMFANSDTYVLEVDADGTSSASSWVHVGTLKNVTADITDEQALLTNGNLLAA